MKNRFNTQSSHSLTGFLWIYIFFSLFFFGNHSLIANTNRKVIVPEQHENVLVSIESQSSCMPFNVYVLANQYRFSFDNDDIQSSSHNSSRFSEPIPVKNSHQPIHHQLKNSAITIRMVSSVLIV
jgi:hypothetical protein